MDYCIGFYRDNKEKNAGAKAPDDVINISKMLGMSIYWIPTNLEKSSIFKKIYWDIIIPLIYWGKFLILVPKNAKVLVQHPSYSPKVRKVIFPLIKKIKKINSVALIHDLYSLRLQGEIGDTELEELKVYDNIIVHNPRMFNYLQSKGFDSSKMIVLELFDYIYPERELKLSTTNLDRVVIAGNLSPEKSKYVYELGEKNPEVTFNLYGVGVQHEKLTLNMDYRGSFSPEELVIRLEGKYGLIWDGDSIETCSGFMGEYTKYNNPHKASLYILAQMPLIVWENSAIADFVLKQNIGIAVKDLNDLSHKLSLITEEEYNNFKKNLVTLSKNVKEGYFTKRALKTAFKKGNQ